MSIEAVFTLAVLVICFIGIAIVSRPRGGYIQYFKDCPLWSKGENE